MKRPCPVRVVADGPARLAADAVTLLEHILELELEQRSRMRCAVTASQRARTRRRRALRSAGN